METGKVGAVYAIPAIVKFTDWVEAYWRGELVPDDPLQRFLGFDRIGEARAWGGAHITVLDYTNFTQISTFKNILKEIVSIIPRPVIRRGRLRLYRGGKQLVLDFDSHDLDQCRKAIETALEPLILKSPLLEEELQRGKLWILGMGKNVRRNLERLATAEKVYRSAGSPPLQAAFPWRLNALVNYTTTSATSKDLKNFLRNGMWPWFKKGGSLHITIASGLSGQEKIEKLEEQLWSEIERRVPAEFELESLAIMEEDLKNIVNVQYWDSLTQTYVRDRRPSLKVAGQVHFAK